MQGHERDTDLAPAPPRRGRRVLVLANEAAPSERLVASIRGHLSERAGARVLVVAPAPNSRMHRRADTEAARTAAVRRLQACIEALAAAGVEAEGMIGDADPLQAVEDAVRIFPADLVIVASLRDERSNRLAHTVVDRATRTFSLPTTHLAA
jgi:hypothetical protein